MLPAGETKSAKADPERDQVTWHHPLLPGCYGPAETKQAPLDSLDVHAIGPSVLSAERPALPPIQT